MDTIKKIEETKGTWLFIIPIEGLRIRKAVDYEIKIDKVTFVDAKKLPGRRKRLGFPSTVSKIKSNYSGLVDKFFDEHNTFATLRLTGKGRDLKKQFIKTVKEEIDILSLSQLGYSRRSHNSKPSLYFNFPSERITSIMFNITRDTSYHPSEVLGKIGPLNLDGTWNNFSKKVFFNNLIKIISGQTKVSPKLRRDIKNAAILAGQSQTSIDIPQCFLLNMIALETLLTQRDDKYSDKLPERAEAFIGWAQDWKIRNFSEKIRDVYQKRCQFVHTGERSQIDIKDILFSDDLLINVIRNIVNHPQLFGSKDKIIEFSNKVQAEHLLGIKSSVRPKTLRFLKMHYKEKDYEKI
jgi:hypothetical protein